MAPTTVPSHGGALGAPIGSGARFVWGAMNPVTMCGYSRDGVGQHPRELQQSLNPVVTGRERLSNLRDEDVDCTLPGRRGRSLPRMQLERVQTGL